MKIESGVLEQTIYIENCLSHPLPEVHEIENTASDNLSPVYEQIRQQERCEDQGTYALPAESNDPCVFGENSTSLSPTVEIGVSNERDSV